MHVCIYHISGRLDQNTVTMALRRVFYSLSLSTTTLTHAGFYTRILTEIIYIISDINQFEYPTAVTYVPLGFTIRSCELDYGIY